MKRRALILCFGLPLALAGTQALFPVYGPDAHGMPAAHAGIAVSRPVTDAELVRNGGFDRDVAGWAKNAIGTHVGDGYGAGGLGPGIQIWPEFDEPYVGFAFQEVFLPTDVTAAQVSLAYQFVPDVGAGLDYFRVTLATDTDTVVTLVDVTPTTYPGELWQTGGPFQLDGAALASLNALHADGRRVYFVLQLRAQSLRVNIDNVSLRVDGSRDEPDWTGSIAFIGLDESGYAKTIRRVEPGGADMKTLWTHPQSGPTNGMYDVAWKPDATELAFASNHEGPFSAFQSDVYGMRSDGSWLRRITNPPSKAALDTEDFAFGTITGKVVNNYGAVSSLMLYIQGAKDAVAVPATEYQQEATFSVPDVAWLGADPNYVVFTWSAEGQANCKEYAAGVVQVLPGQTTDVGTLAFGGTCGEYESSAITWKRDGTEVGVDVITPRRFRATGQSLGTALFGAPVFAEKPAWSPVDDRVLYYDGTPGEQGIYLTQVDGDRGTPIVGDLTALWVAPAWLSDGSGFVFTLVGSLYAFDFGSGQSTPLSYFPGEYVLDPSVSPDGRYVVFDLWSGSTGHDLWIVDRERPVDVWRVTSDGRSSNPDWSGVGPNAGPTATTTSEPSATATNTEAPTVQPSASATETVGPGRTGTPTTTSEPSETPTEPVTSTPTPSDSTATTPAPSHTPTSGAGATDTPTPDLGATFTPTSAAQPSATATGSASFKAYLPALGRGG